MEYISQKVAAYGQFVLVFILLIMIYFTKYSISLCLQGLPSKVLTLQNKQTPILSRLNRNYRKCVLSEKKVSIF